LGHASFKRSSRGKAKVKEKSNLTIYGLGECPACKEGALAAYKWALPEHREIVIECNNCSDAMDAVSVAQTESGGLKLTWPSQRARSTKHEVNVIQ